MRSSSSIAARPMRRLRAPAENRHPKMPTASTTRIKAARIHHPIAGGHHDGGAGACAGAS